MYILLWVMLLAYSKIIHTRYEEYGRNVRNGVVRKQNLLVIILGIILFWYYLSNIRNITTVWETSDEAAYLFNAS